LWELGRTVLGAGVIGAVASVGVAWWNGILARRARVREAYGALFQVLDEFARTTWDKWESPKALDMLWTTLNSARVQVLLVEQDEGRSAEVRKLVLDCFALAHVMVDAPLGGDPIPPSINEIDAHAERAKAFEKRVEDFLSRVRQTVVR
jgi:hypothetical protein